MAVFALAPLAGHVKAARSDPAAARGGICRRDMHLAWKCPRPLPCRGWRRGASARSPFPGAAGPWVPLFPAPGLGEEGRWPC